MNTMEIATNPLSGLEMYFILTKPTL